MNRLKIIATQILTGLFLGVSHHQETQTFIFDSNYFEFGSQTIPHQAKESGEDAWQGNDNILCVADGVGGWIDQGVDPSKYSKELVSNIESIFKQNTAMYIEKPKNLIIDSAKESKNTGSSTCCIMALDKKKPVLRASQIGDSGQLLLNKDFEIKASFTAHTRDFNFPQQIGTMGDDPEISLEQEQSISNNDILVVATDGLFDNLDDEKIIQTLSSCLKNKNITRNLLDQAAKNLGKEAYKLSQKTYYYSPFAKKAKEQGLTLMGGKEDDITIIVAKINVIPQSTKETEL